MINLTALAVQKVIGILEQEKPNLPAAGLRLFVQGGGCSGIQFGMALDKASDGDHVFDQDGIKVIIDKMSFPYLEGAEIDFKEDETGGAFAIKSAKPMPSCSCSHASSCGEASGKGSEGCC